MASEISIKSSNEFGDLNILRCKIFGASGITKKQANLCHIAKQQESTQGTFMQRRELLSLGLKVGALASVSPFLLQDARAANSVRYNNAFDCLDAFVTRYLKEWNAPGLTLSLADETGVQRVCAYGRNDLERQLNLNANELFHIGSITKSFLGLCLVQLQEEGKLDLHQPIHGYLPWLRFDSRERPITAHDLLTHSAALPDGALFPANPALRHQATAAPGTYFHYCNMGYQALGHLLEKIDGKPLRQSFSERILIPLGMKQTQPVITLEAFDRIAVSYQQTYNDRPYPRQGSLSRSVPIIMRDASGCIASTAEDMALYVTMLINRGKTPQGRLVSEAGFAEFSKPHMPADEFGADAAYGYGIAVDRIDGHPRLRHTGGMVSFASAMEIDQENKVGVFASINAMQGYRPRAVAEFALRLMRACRTSTSLPALPPSRPPTEIIDAAAYTGTYTTGDDKQITLEGSAQRLWVLHRGERVAVEATEGSETFTVLHADYACFVLRITRDETRTITGVAWGPEWFAHPSYTGERNFKTPGAWAQLTGHYRNEDPWIGSQRIVSCQGRLWLNGLVPLESDNHGRFWLRDTPESPEWISFSEEVNGKMQRLCLSGADLTRVE